MSDTSKSMTMLDISRVEEVETSIDYSIGTDPTGISLLTTELKRLNQVENLQEELSSMLNVQLDDYSQSLFERVKKVLKAFRFNDRISPQETKVPEKEYELLTVLAYKALVLAINPEESRMLLRCMAYIISQVSSTNDINLFLADKLYNHISKE